MSSSSSSSCCGVTDGTAAGLNRTRRIVGVASLAAALGMGTRMDLRLATAACAGRREVRAMVWYL